MLCRAQPQLCPSLMGAVGPVCSRRRGVPEGPHVAGTSWSGACLGPLGPDTCQLSPSDMCTGVSPQCFSVHCAVLTLYLFNNSKYKGDLEEAAGRPFRAPVWLRPCPPRLLPRQCAPASMVWPAVASASGSRGAFLEGALSEPHGDGAGLASLLRSLLYVYLLEESLL